MAYSNIATAVGILSFAVGIITLYVSILLLKRYRKKPQRATLYISFAILSWSMSFLLASHIYSSAGWSLALAQILQVIMYGCGFTAVIFLYLFAREAFFTRKSKFYYFYIILGLILVVLLGIPGSSYVDRFPDSIGGNYPAIILTTGFGLVMAIYVIPTLIFIVISAFRVASRLGNKLFARGFQVIGLGLIIALGAIASDTIATLLITDAVGYALALLSQWICDLLASICTYVGWTMPGWFQRRYGVKTGIQE